MTEDTFEAQLRARLTAEASGINPPPDLYSTAIARGARRWRRRRLRLLAVPTGTIVLAAAVLVGVVAWPSVKPQGVRVVTPGPSAGRTRTTTVTRSEEQAAWRADKVEARRYAARLVKLVTLPPGSVRTSHPAAHLKEPVNTSIGYGIDDHNYWRVPLPYTAALAWFDHRAPKGASLGSGGSAFQGSPMLWEVGGYTYFPPINQKWPDTLLEVGVTPDGSNATAVRVDGAVGVLDPVPILTGPFRGRLHVTVGGGCPGRVSSDGVGVSNPGRDLNASLLPASPPSGAIICQFGRETKNGGIAGPGHLAIQRRLSPALARSLADTVARVQLAHPVPWNPHQFNPGGCMVVEHAPLIIAFSYSDGPDVDLDVFATGCDGSVDNGTITSQSDGTVGTWIDKLLGESPLR